LYLIAGPISVDPEDIDDVEVDVVECSDSEAVTSRTPVNSRTSTPQTPPSEEERLSPEPISVNLNLIWSTVDVSITA
jgi:hypothetical protein